jgi:hypothetical protein
MATTRKTPQDHKQPQDAHRADDTPQSVTVTVRDIDWTIRAEVMDDMAFLEDLESLEAGKASILPSFCRRLLGAEQYEAAKELVRGESGRVRPAELMELVQEILSAPSSAVVSVGESSAS